MILGRLQDGYKMMSTKGRVFFHGKPAQRGALDVEAQRRALYMGNAATYHLRIKGKIACGRRLTVKWSTDWNGRGRISCLDCLKTIKLGAE